jgi:hypothetical protein
MPVGLSIHICAKTTRKLVPAAYMHRQMRHFAKLTPFAQKIA